MNKVKTYKSKFIEEIIRETSPIEASIIEKKMLIAAKIDDALKAKNWKKKNLMQALGKSNPSEITRWLSGTHNFTMDTLIQLEKVLGINLLNAEPESSPKNLKLRIQIAASYPAFSNDALYDKSYKESDKTPVVAYAESYLTKSLLHYKA